MKIKQQKIDIFNSFVNHEIKSALASTKAYSELLQRAVAKDTNIKAQGYVLKLQQQLEKVISLFGAAIDAHRIVQNDISLHTEYSSIKKILEEVTQFKENIFINDFTDKEVLFDQIVFKKALLMIIDNAEKYAKDSQKIIINVKNLDNRNIGIEIQDKGKGIAKENQDKLFTPFFKTEDSHGLGLGLFIAHQIVIAHKGKLEVASSDKGTSVLLTLPLK